jgi:hypothetical protein
MLISGAFQLYSLLVSAGQLFGQEHNVGFYACG